MISPLNLTSGLSSGDTLVTMPYSAYDANRILAIQKLSRGASVQSAARELGYESASFVTMFRKALGSSPARYMASRLTPT